MDDIDLEVPLRFMPPGGSTAEWPPVEEWTDADWSQWLTQHNNYSYLKQWTDPEVQQYLQVDRYRYGISFQRHKSEPPWWFYLPTPIAVPFHATKVPNILFGGAAGGSKSHTSRHDGYRHGLVIPEYNGIVMRRTFEELERNHLKGVRRESVKVNTYFQETAMEYVETKHTLTIKTHGPGRDGTLLFGHCQNSGDEEKYLGDEYDGFYPDELATFLKKQVTGVAGRLRTKKRGVIARMGATSNPGGVHTLWAKDYFMTKDIAKIREENPRYKPDNWIYLQAMLYDNPYLMDPDGTYTSYEDRLFEYDRERRKQLLLGDWNALSGQFFPEFAESRHCKRLHIPEGSKIERWIDWGYDPHYGMCLWVAILPSGRAYVFAEWKFNGEHAKKKYVASEAADMIKRLTNEQVLTLVKTRRINKSIADRSMWGVEGTSGEDYAETFRKHGVPLTKSDSDRNIGWGRLRHWFRLAPDGDPWLIIDPDCVVTKRCIPAAVRDKSDPDDLDTTGEDHPLDCLRYGVMGRPMPKSTMVSTIVIPDSAGAVLLSLVGDTPRSIGMVG